MANSGIARGAVFGPERGVADPRTLAEHIYRGAPHGAAGRLHPRIDNPA
jgi:hypothetical protein